MLGEMGSREGGMGSWLPPPCTSAVGKRGSANCIRPWIWICMVVSERWKTVRACKGGAESGHRAAGGHPPSPRQHKAGGRLPHTCWKGLLRLWSQYR